MMMIVVILCRRGGGGGTNSGLIRDHKSLSPYFSLPVLDCCVMCVTVKLPGVRSSGSSW